jgi:hypothetical protein
MFVKKRGDSHQLVENYRDESGKHRQRVICNLGQHPSAKLALDAAFLELESLKSFVLVCQRLGVGRGCRTGAMKLSEKSRIGLQW